MDICLYSNLRSDAKERLHTLGSWQKGYVKRLREADSFLMLFLAIGLGKAEVYR